MRRTMLLVLGMSLLFPTLASRAGDLDELRLLDLELEMLSLKSQMLSQEQAAINARLHETTRDPTQSERGRYRVSPSPLELDHITVLDPEPLFPTMRPPWLQPADRLAPMPEEQRMRMWCASPNDCWFP
jgi:hypothetical protein